MVLLAACVAARHYAPHCSCLPTPSDAYFWRCGFQRLSRRHFSSAQSDCAEMQPRRGPGQHRLLVGPTRSHGVPARYDLKLAEAPRSWPARRATSAFNVSAEDIRNVVMKAFPDADITFNVDEKRQGIIDSWPAAVDDGAARRDWGFSPTYDFERAFREYLIPTIRRRYGSDTRN